MMNVKDTINFKTLREKGPSALDIKNDEVIQIVTRGSEIKVIVTQEYFLELLSAYSGLLKRKGLKEERTVDLEEKIKSFEEKLSVMMSRGTSVGTSVGMKRAKQEPAVNKKWLNGRKKAGNN